MIKLTKSIALDASPEAAWKVVGDLREVTSWVPGVVETRVDGGRRVCVMAGDAGEIHEEITDYSELRRSYSYEHLQVPMPVKFSRGSLRVESAGDGARVVWDAEMDPIDSAAEPQLRQMVDGAYDETLQSLKRRIDG